MNEIYQLGQIGLVIFEGYIYFRFWNHFLKLRVGAWWFPAWVMGISVLVLYLINSRNSSSLNLISSMLLCCLDCMILSDDPVRKRLFYAFWGWFVMIGVECVVSLGLMLGNGEVTLTTLMDPGTALLIMAAIKLTTMLVYEIICRYSRHGKKEFYGRMSPWFYCFPLASLVIFIGIRYAGYDADGSTGTSALLQAGCRLLLFANMVLIIVYDRMAVMADRMKEYELTELKNRMISQHYLQMEEVNQRHGEILHDLNGYLATIDQLAGQSENQEIMKILSALNRHITDASAQLYCGHPIVNAVLNEKKQLADSRQVACEVQVEPGFRVPEIPDMDLISIFSNLIDNAVEAAEGCEQGFVRIRLYQVNDGRFAVLKITNNYRQEPKVRRDGTFVTHKQDSAAHGIGVKHTKELVEKNGGLFQTAFQDCRFTVTVMLPGTGGLEAAARRSS
ncbi:MAG: GHKL domain-containing protein [Eubacteriales bacterium]|nr:GHKL domain-containing protein [Eubacteriales bacterium]